MNFGRYWAPANYRFQYRFFDLKSLIELAVVVQGLQIGGTGLRRN